MDWTMKPGRSARRKTLQGISLLWTLLQNGHEELGGTPMAKRIIICCPTSLVSNWDSECAKWLKARHHPSHVPPSSCLSACFGRAYMGVWRAMRGHRFLQGRVRTLPLSESSREDVISSVKDFLSPKAYYSVRDLIVV